MTDNQLFPISEMCPDEMRSVEDFLDLRPEFLAPYSEQSLLSMDKNYKHFSKFIKGLGLTLGQVDQKTVIAYQRYMTANGDSANTYAQRTSHIRTLLNYIGKRFIYRVRKRTAYGNMKIIDEGDFIKILDYIQIKMSDTSSRHHIKYIRDYIVFKLFYITGLRKSELLSLKHKDIYEEAGMHVYQVTVKGGKEVKKEFAKSLVPLIRELRSLEKKGPNHYIFTGTMAGGSIDKQLASHTLNSQLNRYYKKVTGKSERITIHGIRNISGLGVQKLNNDIYNTRAHLNHVSIHTTVTYLEQIAQRTRTPIEGLERLLESK